MRHVNFADVETVLCLGAHSDDIEIGCGGTLLKLIAANPKVSVHWVVFSSTDKRAEEARASAERFLEGAGSKVIEIHRFRDGFFPYDGARIKSYFEELKGRVKPEVIFTHYRDDRHQDHRLINELTWNTYRDHFVLEYEIPKWDGDMGSPNLFVHLTEKECRRKVGTLIECFTTQAGKHWFSDELFMGLMRIRGMESNSPSQYAEGFYARKVAW